MRMEKVNEMMKREISNILQFGDIKDPRVNFVTILNVDVSKDLQYARIRFSILSDKLEDIKEAQDGLNSCRGFIRKLVGQKLVMRYTPELHFIFDKGIQYAVEIDKKLQEIKEQNDREGKLNE